MNKVTASRFFSLALALVLVLSLAACGNAGNTASETTSQASVTEAGTTTAATEAVDYAWEKYTEPVTVTTALRTDGGVKQLDGDTWDDNLWTREIEKTFNIKVKNLWTSDQTQYNNKLNVSIASGDLPDFYSVTNSQFGQAVKSELVYDMTGVYEKYASSAIKHVMDADKLGFESGKVDGKLLGISAQHYGLASIPNCLWIRDDWMKKFNLSAPKTMAELLAMCETFVTKDPDGNGKDDTYGLALSNNLYDTPYAATGLALTDGIFNAYHSYPGIWIKDASGQIVYGSVQPEMKAALAVLQDMCKKGIISKEFGLKDSSKIAEDFTVGKVGVEIGGNWNGYWPAPDVVKKFGDAAVLMPYAIPSADDQPIKLNTIWPVNRYLVVNKACKNPEAVVKIMNLYQKLNLESTPDDWNRFFGADNRSWDCPAGLNDADQTNREYTQISDALKTGDASKLTGSSLSKYEGAKKWADSKDKDSVGYWLQMSEVGSISILQGFIDSNNFMMTEYRGVDTPTMTTKGATLEKLEKETITKIILGASLDEFDRMVENWKKLGGDDITREMNQK